MQILVLHEDVFVAEATVTDVTLVRFLTDMRKADVAHQAVLVAEVLIAQRTLICA